MPRDESPRDHAIENGEDDRNKRDRKRMTLHIDIEKKVSWSAQHHQTRENLMTPSLRRGPTP
jgi:hypothetical protein